jgi:5-bromo-4-chloroindolyl phosphate hydrolysis protein
MIKLTDILSEILNTYEIDMIIQSNTDENISDILDQIRALRKITTVKNITPPEYPQKQNVEYTKVNIKFLSRTGKPEEDLEEFRQEILKSGEDDQRRIPGVTSIKFDIDTLRRI